MSVASSSKNAVKTTYWGFRSLQRKANRTNTKIAEKYDSSHDVNKLHIGCGYRILTGWLNADLRPRTEEVFQFDATKKFPLPSNHFQFVYSEHMIEHIPFSEGSVMLSECFRVLRPGGKIRLATPDVRYLFSLFDSEPTELQQRYINWSCEKFVPEAPSPSASFVFNAFVRKWGHTFIYDQKTLQAALERAGFVEIVKNEISTSNEPALSELEFIDRMPEGFLELESQIFEASKPRG